MEADSEIKTVLLDSDALIALINEEDEFHKKAIKIRDKLEQLETIFVVSRYIIAETATFLTLRVNKQTANRFLTDFSGENISIIDTNEDLEKRTREYFLGQKSKKVTYFDCANMVIMQYYKWKTIFSFDKHYQQNDFFLAEEVV